MDALRCRQYRLLRFSELKEFGFILAFVKVEIVDHGKLTLSDSGPLFRGFGSKGPCKVIVVLLLEVNALGVTVRARSVRLSDISLRDAGFGL